MNEKNISLSFLAIGKTQESTEAVEFKKYIGLASSKIVAVNPTKQELENIYGNSQDKDPEYVVEGENGKEARITFIVKPDAEKYPDAADVLARAMITLRATPAYNRDQTKVQVIDKYGNHTWADAETAKAGGKLLSRDDKELKIDAKYRMACVGEADLVDFLKALLVVEDAFNYVNGSWVKKDNADDCLFALEHIKDYFNGDFSELREAIALQPNNKVKLLYGVRTTEDNKTYQAIATKGDLILRNSAGVNAVAKLESRLAELKANGSYPNTEFKVQELAEWSVESTDLSKEDTSSSSSDMPWD